jgi:asparagine synthase (glutamine-hydrolysing)
MCGICGIVLNDGAASVRADVIENMSDSIVHRGPDDSGQYLSGRVGLGFRRLSIIDLSGGHQPMSNEDESVWIAYNGEIYNHADHRRPLEGRGHVFRTRCDTEAIVHLYEEHGSACPRDLRGMFGFAIWDEKRQSLLLARDRAGIKPMFYALTSAGDLVFGSEIKSILASGMIEPELDESAVAEFFALGSVSGARTLFRGISKLEPGHTLTWHEGRIRLERYWMPPAYEPGALVYRGLPEAADDFWRRFVDAVDITLMSDVPLGVFLSGGLDSSLIVAAMRERGVDALRTFSVGFAEAEASELPFARIVADTFRTEHHEVSCTADQFFAALPRLTRHRDHPLTFSASIPLFFVSELAASSVKVVLTGEGSDELFAGYGRYAQFSRGKCARRDAAARRTAGSRRCRWAPWRRLRGESLEAVIPRACLDVHRVVPRAVRGLRCDTPFVDPGTGGRLRVRAGRPTRRSRVAAVESARGDAAIRPGHVSRGAARQTGPDEHGRVDRESRSISGSSPDRLGGAAASRREASRRYRQGARAARRRARTSTLDHPCAEARLPRAFDAMASRPGR